MSIQALRDKLNRAKREDVGAVFVKTVDLEAALAEYDAIRAGLEQVEWLSGYTPHCCPWCRSQLCDGHKPDCARQSALRQSEGGGE